MSFQKKKNLNVPEKLEKFLMDLTVEILIHNPTDLNEFGYIYFKAINDRKSADSSSQKSQQSIGNDLNKLSVDEFGENQRLRFSSSESEDELPEPNWLDHTKKSRRCSVFSKAYDPEEDTLLSPQDQSTEISDEILKNKPCEEKADAKTHEQKIKLKNVLKSIVIFKFLCEEELDEIIKAMFIRTSDPNEVIINEGDDGHYFYVIFEGVYEVFVRSDGQENEGDESNGVTKCSEYQNEGFFGELALLYDQPRAATIISKESGLLICMKRDKFKKLVVCSSFNRRRNYENFLKSMPLLKFSLNDYEITQVADSLILRECDLGECIFKQNDVADGMYFIEKGVVRVCQEETNADEEKKIEIRELQEGEFFGELALVNKVGRSASVYCSNDVCCRLAFLKLEAFERLIGPCREFIKYKITSYKNVC